MHTKRSADIDRAITRIGALLRHRIQNPLQAILSEAEMLAAEAGGPEQTAPSAGAIAEAGRRIAETVQSFEAWARDALTGEDFAGAADEAAVETAPGRIEADRLTGALATELARLAHSLNAVEHEARLQPRIRRAARLANCWLVVTGGSITSSRADTTVTNTHAAPPGQATAANHTVAAALADRVRRLERELDRLRQARGEPERAGSGFAAHELRNAAQVLSAWLHALRNSEPASRPWYPPLVRAAEAVVRLSQEAMGEPPPAVTPGPEPLDLSDIAQHALESVRPAATDRAIRTAVIAPAHQRIPVAVDPYRAQQVLLNLLRNAITATPVGGAVTITLRTHAGEAIAEVEDTGPGLDPAIVRTLRDQDTPADTAPARHGLGLIISREIARELGGSIRYRETGTGTGAVLAFHLPLAVRP